MPGDRQHRGTQQQGGAGSLLLKYVASIALLVSLICMLSACTNPLFTPSQSGGSSSSVDDSGITPTPSPAVSPTPTTPPAVINFSAVNCPNLSIKWDSLVGTKANVNKVQKVICGSLEGAGTLDALVNVRYYAAGSRLDYYVYDNLSGTPVRRFSMQNLLNGDAQISPIGTIITAEVGASDAIQGSPDVFKEFQWNGSTFAQAMFSGMYPDMTYYQAEQDQAVVTHNASLPVPVNTWKTSFDAVALNLAHNVFHWSSASTTTVQYKPSAGIYIVQINNLSPGGGGFVATMFRLDNVLTNILEVSKVVPVDVNTSISNPVSNATLSSPVTVSGSGTAASNLLGQVLVYNDILFTVGNSGNITSPTSSGVVSFSKSVSYHLNQHGMQEGAIALFTTNQNNTSLSNQVMMVKVFLNG